MVIRSGGQSSGPSVEARGIVENWLFKVNWNAFDLQKVASGKGPKEF
jgi:hypothetical protein